MPQTWDEKGNPIQQATPPIPLPGSAAANPNAPAVMPPPKPKPKQVWDEKGKPVQATPPLAVKPSATAPTSSSTSNPTPPYGGGYSGFTPGHIEEAIKQGGKNFLQSVTGASPLTPGSAGETHGEGGLIETLANIDKHLPEMSQQSEEIRRQSKAAMDRYSSKKGNLGDLAEGMTKSVFSMIPMLGPYLNDQYNRAMSGDVGGSVVETGTTLAAAKIIEHVAGKGPEVVKDVKNVFPKHVIVAVSNEALDHVKNGQVGDAAVEGSRDTSKMGTAVQATKDRIGAKFSSINTADKIKNPNGFVPSSVALTTIDKAIADKGAKVLFDKRMMPSVAKIRALVEGYKGNLTFDNIKQMRTFIGDYFEKSSGVERAVLGDLYSSYTQVLKARSAQLGQLDDFIEANTDTENLKKHQAGIIKDLKSKNTGLQYFNEISKESNQGRLSDLERDLHLPSGFFADTIRDYKPLHRVAALIEGSSVTGMKGSRISAFMRHPLAVTGGVAAGGGAGAGVGMLMGGHALTGSILGMTAAALKVDDFLNRYDAAKAIREMGGPDNVTGRSSRMTPSAGPGPGPGGPAGPTGTSMTGPPTGPGGGGTNPSTLPPVTPSGPPPSGGSLSPALEKLLPEVTESKAKEVGGREARGAEASAAVAENKPFQKAQFDSAISKAKEVIRDPKATVEEKNIAKSQLKSYREQAAKLEDSAKEAKPQGGHAGGGVASVEELNRPGRFVKISKSGMPTDQGKVPDFNLKEGEAGYQVKPDGTYELKSGKETPTTKNGVERYSKGVYPPEARGRMESARKGMTKDTPEARRAKAAERIASRREEASRTQIKGSLEDQARQVAGRMDFQGKSNLELEEGLKELFGENGSRFLKQFQSLARQQKWSDEVYRGYLEDTLDRRAKELAQRPNIPGLGTEPKVE